MKTAVEVAEQMILLAKQEEGLVDSISPLKLQKLLFFAQGWYAANNNERLFEDDIWAWKHGPVVEDVYHKYKEFGSQDLKQVELSVKKDKALAQALTPVLKVYGNMSAYELVSRTHKEEVWRKNYQAWNKLIPFEEIRLAFKRKLDAAA